MKSAKSLGERLRRLRDEKGETQAVVAEAVGIERASLSMIERGHDMPGLHTLRALADYFGVTLDYIESGTPLPRVEMPADPTQSLEEAEMLLVWRDLGADNRRVIMGLMEKLAGLDDDKTRHQIPPSTKATRAS